MNIYDHEWLNAGSLGDYPIADGRAGQVPRGLLADAFVAGSFPGGACLIAASVTRLAASVVIGDASGNAMGHATAVFGGGRYPASEIAQIPGGAPVSGRVVFGSIFDPSERGDLSEFMGSHIFGAGEAPLCPRCWIDCGEPPLRSISCAGKIGLASGAISISPGPGVAAAVTQETHASGEPISVITLSLASPQDLLNPCSPKTADPRGACGEGAIKAINGVSRNPATKGIRIEFKPQPSEPLGGVSVDAPTHTVELEVLAKTSEMCVEQPALPDQHGRMPDNFDSDCPPQTAYGSDPGPPCISPDDLGGE